ncbi:HlyD family efflux transporter periplasmic adaptor subunit [Calothrix sp. NIES-2098]|uniref:HlyD family efflux transporter periplasmic adaptor subunit n=1 Tax=Calothrix sp. NIES-2098 TaxID=1954171 RepID=UPI000B618E53|nr:HlyD family secretion protein [Calothrix sp. NIES-2098]
MPNLSHNSSSMLAQTMQDGSVSNEAADEVNNWYYGTEELLETLPQLWTRSILYLILGFLAIALPWAMLSKVDETGSARGRLEPKGATQRLDSSVNASVTAVKVKEGDKVRAGQLLVQLESDVLQTELQQINTKLEGLKNRLAQLELVKNQLMLSISVQEQQNKSQELEKAAQVNQAQENLETKQNTYNLQKLEKQALVEEAQQEIATTQNDQKSTHELVAIDARQVERFNKLVTDGAVSATQIDQLRKEAQQSKRLYEKAQSDVKQAKLHLTGEMSRYQSTMNQLTSEIKQATLHLQEQKSSYQSLLQTGKLAVLKNQQQLKDLQIQITALQSEIAQTVSQIVSLKLQLQQRIVRSPINGTIFALPISKPGSVVQPGQMIAQIAPQNTSFVLKAQMSSQQSGFLQVGMPVKIKFDAYPFQDYGVLQGKLNWISPDSKIQPTNSGNLETYELEIALANPYIQTANKRILLTPGQTATAEVIIRQRRVIDFILDPFKKLQSSGLKL